MRKFVELLKDRFEKYELYNKREYWGERIRQRSGLARSMWSSNNFNKCLHATEKKNISNLLTPLDGSKILDIGCGIGRMSTYLAGFGSHVTGLDVSPIAIETAKSEFPPNLPGKTQYIVGDLIKTDMQQGLFDVILSIATLTLIFHDRESFQKGIERICRFTKSGGKILLIEPIHSTWFLKRICGYPMQEWILEFEKNNAQLLLRDELVFFPFRIFLATFNILFPITRFLFSFGELMFKMPCMGWFSDYKVLLFEKKCK